MSQKVLHSHTAHRTPSPQGSTVCSGVSKAVALIVERRDNESAERLLNRFRLVVQRSGVLRDQKRRRHFTSKSEVRRMARAKAIRRLRKNAAKAEARDGRRPRGARQK